MELVLYSAPQKKRGRLRIYTWLLLFLFAVTAVLGLLPLAIGLNFNFFTLFTELDPHIHMGGDNVVFWGPLSWAVIYGLIFATFLTLIMVPVMLLIVMKIKHRRQWKRDLKAQETARANGLLVSTPTR